MAEMTLDQVRKVAGLAQLAIDDAEAEALRRDLEAFLGHFRSLDALDLGGVEPMVRPFAPGNRWSEDEPGPMLKPDTLSQLTEHTDGPFIRVPRVLGGGSSS